MEAVLVLLCLSLAAGAVIVFLADVLWLSPRRAYSRVRRGGLDGPEPSFPLGNIKEMARKTRIVDRELSSTPPSCVVSSTTGVTHDIHSRVFPYFARWRKEYGKVFVYWLGTEPFLYVGDPEFLKQATAGIMAKHWGKPNVFKVDRKPMFGHGLVMVEGDSWAFHRNIISPAFSSPNLNAMIGMMVESTTGMIEEWSGLVSSGCNHVNVEEEVTRNAADIISKTSFGVQHQESGKKIYEKLIELHMLLFKTNRLVGVPFSKLLHLRQTVEAAALGKDIDRLLLAAINSRKAQVAGPQRDLLGLLLAGNYNEATARSQKKLTARELVDECKTFFFAGHETTALAVTWTLLLLAVHPEWQRALRDEVNVAFDGAAEVDSDVLAKLIKMEWVFNEVLRLYPPAPNTQRQTREDIKVGGVVIPKGTNIWIDTVGMHHDKELWGEDADEFKPERFRECSSGATGGCKHRMGFLPFGFGGRMCVGRNLTRIEYKIVLSLVLKKFSLSVSPAYRHSPAVILTLRPTDGVHLVLHPLED